MKIIEPKVELWQQVDDVKDHVARCARVCYGRESGNDKLKHFHVKIIVILISLMT